MKLWINLATFVETMRKLLTVFKLATADACWHSLMEAVNPAHPLSLSELWINWDAWRWPDGEQNASLITDKENDGDWGNNRFLKLFPRIKLAFPPSYWQCRKKDMFLLGFSTLFYMAETQLLSESTFGLLKGSRKMCYESPMLCPKLSNEKIWGSLCGGISKGTGVFRENFSSGRPWSGR